MDRVLRFKHHLRPVLAGGERVFLLGEQEQFVLKGRLYELVASMLDGQRSIREIISALEDHAHPAEVYYTIDSLLDKGYLVDASPELDAGVAAFWQSLGIEPGAARDRLDAVSVAVMRVGAEAATAAATATATTTGAETEAAAKDEGDIEPARRALEAAGLRVDSQADLVLVITDDYLAPELETLNLRAIAEGSPRWMLLKPTGTTAWIGPIFRPGEGPCWTCLAARIRHNRPVEAFLQSRSGDQQKRTPPPSVTPASSLSALHLAAVHLARFIASGGHSPLTSALLTLELAGTNAETHSIKKRPQCPVCGDKDLLRRRAESPIALTTRPKRAADNPDSKSEGAYRLRSPDETFAALRDQISPITGIVRRLEPLAGRDDPLRPVYGAIVPAPPIDNQTNEFFLPGWGRGRSQTEARASALCEAIERYSGMAHGDEPLVRARAADLGEGAIHPRALLGFSEAQYHHRTELNARISERRHAIPEPFDDRAEIAWAPAWSLARPERRYLPAAYCYSRFPRAEEARFFPQDSNGQAAGSCLEEAILHGLFELVERDAVALWWYNRALRPKVDLQSFDDRYFDEIHRRYEAMGLPLWVLDITSDVGVPAFTAVACDADAGRLTVGFGCHLDAKIGVERALTELNQLFSPKRALPPGWSGVPLREQVYLFPDEQKPPRAASDFAAAQRGDLRADVLACVDLFARAGLDPFAIDLTQPDIELSVVRVFAPGMRHFWPRLGPGRLYEIPVRLGWLNEPLREDELNPLPIVW